MNAPTTPPHFQGNDQTVRIHRIGGWLYSSDDLKIEGDLVQPTNQNVRYPMGVSHLVPYRCEYDALHSSLRSPFRQFGCKLTTGAGLPEGLGMMQEHQLGCREVCDHYVVFPTRAMPVAEFDRKLMSIYTNEGGRGGCPGSPHRDCIACIDTSCAICGGEAGDGTSCGLSDGIGCGGSGGESVIGNRRDNHACGDVELRAIHEGCWCFKPCYPEDAILREAAAVLFELAKHPVTEANRALRALHFHYTVSSPGFDPDWLCEPDNALSIVLSEALEVCEDATTESREETRDFLRYRLQKMIAGYSPTFRNCCMDDLSVEETVDSVLLFGDQLSGDPVGEVNSEPFSVRLTEVIRDIRHAWEAQPLSRERREFLDVLSAVNEYRGTVDCMAGSLLAEIKDIPRSMAQLFRNFLIDSPKMSDVLVSTIVRLGGFPRLAESTIAVKVRSSCVPRSIPTCYGLLDGKVFVSVFRTNHLDEQKGRAVARSISKFLENLRDHAWMLEDRITVLCVSKCHLVELNAVVPESMPEFEDRRKALSRAMRNDTNLQPLFIDGTEDTLKSSDSNLHLFWLFSLGQRVHFNAFPEMERCLERLGIHYEEFANVVAV